MYSEEFKNYARPMNGVKLFSFKKGRYGRGDDYGIFTKFFY